MDTKYLRKRINKLMPEFLQHLAKDYEFFIAGGAITSLVTNKDVNDLDIYLKPNTDIFKFTKDVLDSATLMSTTPKSFMVNHSGCYLINVIIIDTFQTAEDIFDAFDFTCVMGAYDVSEDEFHFHEDFLLHNSQRILKFNPNTKFPLMSAIRVKKYEERGYKISRNEMLRVLLQCSTLDISSYEELAEQIGGLYGIDVEKVFDTSKDFKLDDIIAQISEIDFDIYKNSKDVDTSIIYEQIYRLHLKEDVKLTRIPITIFSDHKEPMPRSLLQSGGKKEMGKETSYFLGINGMLHSMPDFLKDAKLEEQFFDIIVQHPVRKSETSELYHLNGHDFKIGEEKEIADASSNNYKGFHIKTFDNPSYHSKNIGLFKVQANFCEKVSKNKVGRGALTFSKMQLMEVVDYYERKIVDIFDWL